MSDKEQLRKEFKIWTDGKDVFVVPVKELPDPSQYPMEMYEGRQRYALELMRHSIKVENVTARTYAEAGTVTVNLPNHTPMMRVGTLYDLPEGYRIARMRDCKRCGVILDGTCKHTEPCDFMMPYRFPPNAFVFHILPVEKQQREDELWSRVEDLAYKAMANYMGYHSESLSGQLAYNIREEIRTEFDLIRRS